jgi:hypothetical protein
MITYKNISCSVKTFYGVTFMPNDVKEVSGYINDRGMVRVFNVKKSAPKKRTYNKKPVISESKPVDSTSTENINLVKLDKEETPNG